MRNGRAPPSPGNSTLAPTTRKERGRGGESLYESYGYGTDAYALAPDVNDWSVECNRGPPVVKNSPATNAPLLLGLGKILSP